MRLSHLAMTIDRVVPPIPSPDVGLEQYTTPGDLAARAAFILASTAGGLEGLTVADLGAGTCRLSAAAALLGAGRVIAVEADRRLLPLCREASRELGVEGVVAPVHGVVSRSRGPIGGADAVLMNPPFGVWRRGADTAFVLYAMSLGASPIVAILKHGNLEYFRGLASRMGYRVWSALEYWFPIPASMPRHRSRIRRIRVEVLVFESDQEAGRVRRGPGNYRGV